ncbi:MAG: GlsB/YeaQ/YmgE family stress response membrane protein [Thermomicrobiales bacterium]
MGIISWIIVGIAAGWLAGVITRTKRGVWGNLVLGLIGAVVAGWITNNRVGGDAGLISSIIVSAIVAAALVFIKELIAGRSS